MLNNCGPSADDLQATLGRRLERCPDIFALFFFLFLSLSFFKASRSKNSSISEKHNINLFKCICKSKNTTFSHSLLFVFSITLPKAFY